MARLLLLATVLLLVLAFQPGHSRSTNRRGQSAWPSGVMNKPTLTRLYNSPVVKTELVKRPMFGNGKVSRWLAEKTPLHHAGVVGTLDDGSRWLVHKGPKFGGRGGDTVVVNADQMSSAWKQKESRDVGNVRVADLVKAGGTNYRLFGNNCQDAAGRMMQQGSGCRVGG